MNEIAGIYCRLSEEDRHKKSREEDSESIQNQKSMLITYAMERGWEIYSIYSDDDYTGSDRSRPEFNRMLADAEEGKINIVLCKSQSRFSRELEIVEKYIHGYFLLWNVRFVSVVDNADTALRGNKKARQINGLINEWYLEDMSESIKSVLDDKRSKGLHIGSSVVYGYKKDPERKGHIIIDEPAAKVVHEIFELFSAGMGKTAIARLLNERKEPNPTEYKRIHHLYHKRYSGKYSTLWSVQVIRRILKNEMYIGNMIQGTTGTVSYKISKTVRKPPEQWFYIQGTHERIIEKELWETVQHLLNTRYRSCSSGKMGIFAGKAQCAYCGYAMHLGTKRGRKYLACGNKYRIPGSCEGSFIPEAVLASVVLEQFHDMAARYLDEEGAEAQITFPDDNGQEEVIRKKITALANRMNRSKNALKDIFVDKANGDITAEEFEEFADAFRAEIKKYQQEIEYHEKALETVCARNAQEHVKKELLQKYRSIEQLDRDIMNIFVHSIEIGHRKNRSEEYPIKIYWNF